MKPPPSQTPGSRSGVVSVRLLAVIAAICLIPILLIADPPGWWAVRNVTNGNTANDFAAINQGQLKNIATAAFIELNTNLPGGVGDMTAPSGTLPGGTGYQLTALINSWSASGTETPGASTNDFAAVNIGQAKNVAKLFYNRLIEVGYTNQYPWTSSTNTPNDFAAVNIGQVKNLFSFDVTSVSAWNGLPDWWQLDNFGHIGVNPNAQGPNLNGHTILYDFQNGLSPLATGSGSSYVSGAANPGGGGETSGTWTADSSLGMPDLGIHYLACDGKPDDDLTWDYQIAELTWTPNVAENVDHYLIEQKIDAGSWTTTGTTASTLYDAGMDGGGVGHLQSGPRYQFRVTALDSSGRKGEPDYISYNVPVIKGISVSNLNASMNEDFTGLIGELDSDYDPIFLSDGYYGEAVIPNMLLILYYNSQYYTNANLTDPTAFGYWADMTPLAHIDGTAANMEPYTLDDLQGLVADKSFQIYTVGGHDVAGEVYSTHGTLTPLQYQVAFYPSSDGSSLAWDHQDVLHPALSVIDGTMAGASYVVTGSNYYDYYGNVISWNAASNTTSEPQTVTTSTSSITSSGTLQMIPDEDDDLASEDYDTWWTHGGTITITTSLNIKIYDGSNSAQDQGYLDEWEKFHNPAVIETGTGSINFDVEGVVSGVTQLYYDSTDFQIYQSGSLVANGGVLTSGTGFTMVATDSAEDGLTGISVVTEEPTWTADNAMVLYHGAPPGGSTVPFDEASGPRYRKIGLNGRPLSDEKPQHTAESDEEKEETYIDALTLGLHHSTTDVYVPIPGSDDLTITARRDTLSENWNMQSGLRPHERLDRPFGAGWSSNLTANLEEVQNVISTGTDSSVTMIYFYVTDQNGGSHRFMQASDGSYIPMPSDQRENGDYLTTLALLGDGVTYVFTDRYGTQITFESSPVSNRTINSDRFKGTGTEVHTQYAVANIQDRFGNKLDYHYPGSSVTLIPDTITLDGHADQVLSIRQNATGQITDIWDPNGGHYAYGYTTETYTFAGNTYNETVLTSVTAPGGAVTNYGYDCAMADPAYPTGDSPGLTAVEADQTPISVSRGEIVNKYHLDVNSITDPLGNQYAFNYAFDASKWDYSTADGYFQETGAPRNVVEVLLPNSLGTTTLVNNSNTWLTYVGGNPAVTPGSLRQTVVTDAAGQIITYTFGVASNTTQVFNVGGLTVGTPPAYTPKIVFYLDMKIDYGTGLGSEYFTFDPTAGLALSSVTDFSGNTTSYVYGDTYNPPDIWWTVFPYTNGSGVSFFTCYEDPTQQTDALGNSKYFTYGPYQIMSSVTDENGILKTYNVDSLGRRLNEIIFNADYSYAQETEYQYDTTFLGVVTQKAVVPAGSGTDPWWVFTLQDNYTLDGDGRVASETVVDNINGTAGLTTSYTYDPDGSKLSATDPLGHTTWFGYDARERPTSVIHADGTQKSFVYDARGNKTADYDENGIATLYQYDALNRLTAQARDMNGNNSIDAGDLITQYAYNAVNSKTSVTDPNGHTTSMTYDGLQRLLTVTDPLSHVTTYTYDGANTGSGAFDTTGFKPTSVTDPLGWVTTATYDALYRTTGKVMTYTTSGSISTTSTTYDNVGNPVTTTDPLGHTTTSTYDALNRVTEITFPDTTTNQFFYTSTGLKYEAIDENGVVAQMQYDFAGRPVTAIADAGGLNATTQTVYDLDGNVTATINPLGKEWDYQYDARNRKIAELAPSVTEATTGITSQPLKTWQYDNTGNVIASMDPRLNRTDTTYDAANRPVQVQQPPATFGDGNRPTASTTYDLNGNVLTVTDPDNHTTTNTYDALNRLLTTTDAASNVVTNTYDADGNRLTVTDGNSHTTHFAYDGLKRNTTTTDPLTHVTTFTYDALNKTNRTDALSHITSYTYDSRNRLATATYTGRTADNRTYNYDDVGNLLSVTLSGYSGAADTAYTYDNLRRVATETSGGLTHNYTYDLAGNRLTTEYGGTGRTITSTYDALNRLATMTESGRTTTYGYDLSGNNVLKTLPNGDAISTGYDALNRTRMQFAISGASQTLYQYGYTYDLAGNVLGVAEAYPGGLNNRTVTNTYDSIYRLTNEADSVNGTTGYAYDAANNRTSKTISSGTTATYTYNALNQLTAISGTESDTFTYDLNGNRFTKVVGSGTDTYSYDYENRLVGLTKSIGGTGITTGTYAYNYDYRTRRVTRDESGAGGAVTQVIFSGGLSVQEYDNSGTTPSVEYIRGSDYGGGVGGVLYTLRSGTPSYTHENRRGDVVAKTDAGGSLTYQAMYQASGKRIQEQGSTQDRQKANTKDQDPWGGILEGFRITTIEGDLRTFLSKDPAGFVDGPNLYTYCKQNPWTSFDPKGLQDLKNAGDGISTNNNSLGGLWNRAKAAAHQAFSPGNDSTVQPDTPNAKAAELVNKGLDNVTAPIDTVVNSAQVVEDISSGLPITNANGVAVDVVEIVIDQILDDQTSNAGTSGGDPSGESAKATQDTSQDAAQNSQDASNQGTTQDTSQDDTQDDTQETNGQSNESVDDKVHGNSKNSTNPQVGYEVRDSNGNIIKYGITGQAPDDDGKYKRVEQQGGTVIKKIPGGKGARQKALDWEQQMVDDHAAQNGGQGPPGNKLPKPSSTPPPAN